jgi:hypothetical protein
VVNTKVVSKVTVRTGQ